MAECHLVRIHSERGPAGGVRPFEGPPGWPHIGESPLMATPIGELLGTEAENLLKHVCKTIPKESLHLPGPDFVDRIFAPSDRNPRVLGNLQRLFSTGRLAGTGYLSILPVDQGIEHSGRRQLRQEPDLLRSGEHRQAGDRRRLQRRRLAPSASWAPSLASTPTRSRSWSRSTTTSC